MSRETKKISSHVVNMDDEQIRDLHHLLEMQGWEFGLIAHAHWQGKRNRTTVTAYHSGKVTIQGRDTEEVVLFLIEPKITGNAVLGYEPDGPTPEPDGLFRAHAGVDESGKGDYFGPLVIATAYVDETDAPKLRKLGVRDSKTIKNDIAIQKMAASIRHSLGGRFALVTIGPEAYNRLYTKIGNLNRLLAWGHARALENLMEKVPECREAIADKFGDERLITNALMEKGRKIRLVQIVKGERDLAVAAASILARDGFVSRLDRMGRELGIRMPKGAGPEVIRRGQEIMRQHGQEKLATVAKLHFRTTGQILSSTTDISSMENN